MAQKRAGDFPDVVQSVCLSESAATQSGDPLEKTALIELRDLTEGSCVPREDPGPSNTTLIMTV